MILQPNKCSKQKLITVLANVLNNYNQAFILIAF